MRDKEIIIEEIIELTKKIDDISSNPDIVWGVNINNPVIKEVIMKRWHDILEKEFNKIITNSTYFSPPVSSAEEALTMEKLDEVIRAMEEQYPIEFRRAQLRNKIWPAYLPFKWHYDVDKETE